MLVVERGTLYVHTAGGEKGYTLHVHTAAGVGRGEKDTPCTSNLLAMERDTPCTSILLVMERDTSNGNASEAKANEGFDNSIFFASEAKRTCSLEGNSLAKRSEHVRKK